MITIQEILDQAHASFCLVHEHEERDLNELTEEDIAELWEFAFRTYQAAAEDGEVDFSLADLEAAFNEPQGCPT